MKSISIDFSDKIKRIKPLHGVNNAPYEKDTGKNQQLIEECFREIGVPYACLHDFCGSYGGCYFVDVPNIFRDFDADENDPANYEFHYTDEAISAIVNTGAQIVYRLGVTIEWGTKQYVSHPPRDYEKWSRICEHIVLHYNHGWANGFRFGITYWEIWNEPENPPMWTGTKQQYLDLYKTAALHLKAKFPEIKIGGYGSCGFYALTSRKGEFWEGFVTYFYDFLKMIKADSVPFDFYSWHLYTDDFEELKTHAKFVRDTLNEYGFRDVEVHFNEWNVGGEGGGFALMRNMIGASYAALVLCYMQNTDTVDKAMYYDFRKQSGYNGFLDQNLYWKTCTYYAFVWFGKLYRCGMQVRSECDDERLHCVAAVGNGGGAALLADYDGEGGVYDLELKGLKKNALLTISSLNEKEPVHKESIYSCNGDEVRTRIAVPQHGVLFVEWK